VLVLVLAVAASGCVGKSGAVYSRPGTEPSQNPDASPGVDAPGPPDALLPDVPVGTGPDLSIGGPDVPAASPCANNVVDGTETDIDCGGAACGKCANGKRCALATDCAGDGVYEFLLVAPPLPVTGAVGAPVNPIAIK
jgi:hypothetical protein